MSDLFINVQVVTVFYLCSTVFTLCNPVGSRLECATCTDCKFLHDTFLR